MDYQIIITISIIILVVIILVIGSFASNMQTITLWVGKKIAPEGSDKELPRGFQDAITPKFQDNLNTILPISYVLLIIIGTLKHWYIGVPLLIAVLIMVSFLKKLWTYDVSHYLKLIIFGMNNKIADYIKNNDSMRADAGKEVLEQLEIVYSEVRDLKMKVPDFSSVRKMRAGSDL